MATEKPIHTVVLDTVAILRNTPTVSTLIKQAEELVTVPAVVSEIKDAEARSRFETIWQPFVSLRTPRPESLKFVTDFARKTGDLAVLSRTDLQLIALAYELECERNGGDWRLRNSPGQKRTNGPPPAPVQNHSTESAEDLHSDIKGLDGVAVDAQTRDTAGLATVNSTSGTAVAEPPKTTKEHTIDEISNALEDSILEENTQDACPEHTVSTQSASIQDFTEEKDASNSEESDSEGWITPSNIKKRQAEDAQSAVTDVLEPKTMQVATITQDFAMQNVLLQINLNLLSPSLQRVKHLKTFVLRCHACFTTTKDMSKQFCQRCGKPTLTRVACSTNAKGEFKLHLKKNMQWNTRGDRYSIPKPVSGSANGRVQGGGKGGWGQGLILAEDQKEYVRSITQEKKERHKDLMDEDYLPSILTGDRSRTGGRPKIGAGRNVNSKKR